MRLSAVLSLVALVTAAGSVWPQGKLPEPLRVLPARPPQPTILVMPVPEATLDKVSRGTLTARFPREVLDSVLRGAYRMPSHPNLPPIPRLPFRLKPEGGIQYRLLVQPSLRAADQSDTTGPGRQPSQ